MTTHTVVRQDWIESELGWGMRLDGYSLHLSEADREAFIKDYWAKMPNQIPNEYSFPGSTKLVDVDDATHRKLQAQRGAAKPLGTSRYGLWLG